MDNLEAIKMIRSGQWSELETKLLNDLVREFEDRIRTLENDNAVLRMDRTDAQRFALELNDEIRISKKMVDFYQHWVERLFKTMEVAGISSKDIRRSFQDEMSEFSRKVSSEANDRKVRV